MDNRNRAGILAHIGNLRNNENRRDHLVRLLKSDLPTLATSLLRRFRSLLAFLA